MVRNVVFKFSCGDDLKYSYFEYHGKNYRVFFKRDYEKYTNDILKEYGYEVSKYEGHYVITKIIDREVVDGDCTRNEVQYDNFTMDTNLLLWLMCEDCIVVSRIS